uniref:Secologanin synthase n=1 Tax=Triticum urartu TaxID=4572 RepID=A0A8R7PJX0_TRIUA
MTIKEVMEECKLLYLAWTETTSILLTWTMIVLSMHPEWQDRAREEVISLFGKNKLEYEGVNRLKTVTTILYEVLRLYSPAGGFIRKTYKEMKIGDITYPVGVLIELPVFQMNHDPHIWGSDVHEFKPERFANGISKASKYPGAFLPFSWGPRICISQQFAMLEGKMALCMILQCFEFELASSYTHAVDNSRVMRPTHGAQINLTAI